MSGNSKRRREARRPTPPAAGLQPHAEILVDGQRAAGAGLRDGEWVAVLGGRELSGTDSAAMLVAMLHHIAAGFEAKGHRVVLSQSTQLHQAAVAEAAAGGRTLEEHLVMLEAERQERLLRHDGGSPD